MQDCSTQDNNTTKLEQDCSILRPTTTNYQERLTRPNHMERCAFPAWSRPNPGPKSRPLHTPPPKKTPRFRGEKKNKTKGQEKRRLTCTGTSEKKRKKQNKLSGTIVLLQHAHKETLRNPVHRTIGYLQGPLWSYTCSPATKSKVKL